MDLFVNNLLRSRKSVSFMYVSCIQSFNMHWVKEQTQKDLILCDSIYLKFSIRQKAVGIRTVTAPAGGELMGNEYKKISGMTVFNLDLGDGYIYIFLCQNLHLRNIHLLFVQIISLQNVVLFLYFCFVLFGTWGLNPGPYTY